MPEFKNSALLSRYDMLKAGYKRVIKGVDKMEEGKPENMAVMTLENEDSKIVARLYILDNGNLHPDSWLCPGGWGQASGEGGEK